MFVVRWNNRDIEATARHSPAGQRDFVKVCGRTKHAFPLPSTRRARERRGDALRGRIPFHGWRTRLMKAEPRVHLNRSCSASATWAGSLPAECWGGGCLRVGSKRCLPSNPPLSSSHQSCRLRRNLKIPAVIIFVLFSFQRQKTTRPVRPPASPRDTTRLSAFRLCCKAAGAGGGGSLHLQLETRRWEGSFAGILLMKPLTYFSGRDLFRQPLGSCGGEVAPCPRSAGPQGSPAGRRSAGQRLEPTRGLAGAHPLYSSAKSAFARQPPLRASRSQGDVPSPALLE